MMMPNEGDAFKRKGEYAPATNDSVMNEHPIPLKYSAFDETATNVVQPNDVRLVMELNRRQKNQRKCDFCRRHQMLCLVITVIVIIVFLICLTLGIAHATGLLWKTSDSHHIQSARLYGELIILTSSNSQNMTNHNSSRSDLQPFIDMPPPTNLMDFLIATGMNVHYILNETKSVVSGLMSEAANMTLFCTTNLCSDLQMSDISMQNSSLNSSFSFEISPRQFDYVDSNKNLRADFGPATALYLTNLIPLHYAMLFNPNFTIQYDFDKFCSQTNVKCENDLQPDALAILGEAPHGHGHRGSLRNRTHNNNNGTQITWRDMDLVDDKSAMILDIDPDSSDPYSDSTDRPSSDKESTPDRTTEVASDRAETVSDRAETVSDRAETVSDRAETASDWTKAAPDRTEAAVALFAGETAGTTTTTSVEGSSTPSGVMTRAGFLDLASPPSQLDRSAIGSVPRCHAKEFTCADKIHKIPEYQTCDGKFHCSDGSDEVDCVTCKTSFSCKSSTNNRTVCLRGQNVCDGRVHCADWSDERKYCRTNCAADEYKCHDSNVCLPKTFLCDGDKHCPKGDDETNCKSLDSCNNQALWCSFSSRCLSWYGWCDGTETCDMNQRP